MGPKKGGSEFSISDRFLINPFDVLQIKVKLQMKQVRDLRSLNIEELLSEMTPFIFERGKIRQTRLDPFPLDSECPLS